MKKLFIGIIISLIFLFFTFRGVNYELVFEKIRNLNLGFLFLSIIMLILMSFFRSLRWGLLLSPLEKLSQKKLYPITCIGYMSVIIIPMRLGEFIRPYLVSIDSRIPFSSALATIIVERVMDILTILGILFFIIMVSTTPPWLVRMASILLPATVLLVLFIFVLYFNTAFTLRMISPIFKILPKKTSKKVDELLRSFIKGFRIIAHLKKLFSAMLFSILIWTSAGLAIYILFFSLDFHFSLLIAFIVLIVTIIGVSLPAAPGMIGNFQFGCILALTFFGVQKSDAFIFSMVYYFIGIGTTVFLGLIFLPFTKISFKGIYKRLVGN